MSDIFSRFTNNVIRKTYLNENATSFSFNKLTENEKNELISERILTELAAISSNKLIEVNLDDPLLVLVSNNINKLSSFSEFNVVKSNLVNMIALNGTNSSLSTSKSNISIFNDKAKEVIKAYDSVIKYEKTINDIIKEEASLPNNSKVKVAYVTNIIYLIIVLGNALTAKGFNSNFNSKSTQILGDNVTIKPTFEIDDKKYMENSFSVIHYFNQLCITGKFTTLMKTPSAEITSYSNGKLDESTIMDFIMSVITKNKVAELLLVPIYIIRGFVYFSYYLKNLVKGIVDSNAKTRELLSSSKLNHKDLKNYSDDLELKSHQYDQADKSMGESINSSFNKSNNVLI